MPRFTTLLPLALATLSVPALVAQTAPAGQTPSPDSPSAPIERHAPTPDQYATQQGMQGNPAQPYNATLKPGDVLTAAHGVASAQPVPGVYLRVAPNSAVREVASDAQHTEFRIERGVANISVHHPADGMLLLVDLPNGQVQMLKNGLYTFNAATKTVRVLKGEANAFAASAPPDAKPVKVKEEHAVTFAANAARLRSVEFYPFQAGADLIPQPYDYARTTDRPGYGYGYGYGYGPYYGFYGEPYPYYAWGYPFAFGFGYGFYGGGFYGGGFRGGFRGR